MISGEAEIAATTIAAIAGGAPVPLSPEVKSPDMISASAPITTTPMSRITIDGSTGSPDSSAVSIPSLFTRG
ncbi:hypothetical protein D3C78_1837360 [compost metagenome]